MNIMLKKAVSIILAMLMVLGGSSIQPTLGPR